LVGSGKSAKLRETLRYWYCGPMVSKIISVEGGLFYGDYVVKSVVIRMGELEGFGFESHLV
jgi:hypothetical protein